MIFYSFYFFFFYLLFSFFLLFCPFLSIFFFFSYIGSNKGIAGKVLKNKSLKECGYGYSDDNYDLCIPKDFESNCISGNEFKTCNEGEESSVGQCGEGLGKCPYSQCCSKDGKCGTTSDFCYMSKKCQIKYGYCVDECEEIYEQLKKFNEDAKYQVTCIANEQKRAQTL